MSSPHPQEMLSLNRPLDKFASGIKPPDHFLSTSFSWEEAPPGCFTGNFPSALSVPLHFSIKYFAKIQLGLLVQLPHASSRIAPLPGLHISRNHLDVGQRSNSPLTTLTGPWTKDPCPETFPIRALKEFACHSCGRV